MTRKLLDSGVRYVPALLAVVLLAGWASGTSTSGRKRQAPTAQAPSRGPQVIGSPSMIARIPAEAWTVDADGDFIAWATESSGCAIHFVRISDRRRAQSRGSACTDDRGTVSELALNRSRAVWATEWAGIYEQGVDIGTATFDSPRIHWVAGGYDGCSDPTPCNRDPIIDSSGGSLVAQFFSGDYTEEDVRTVIVKVGAKAEELSVEPGTGVAVHGDRLAVARGASVELRRLGDGGLIRTWPLRRKGTLVLSQTLLVVESGYRLRRIDVYDQSTGRFLVTVRYRGSNSQPLADGVLFFSGSALRYVSRSGRISTLINATRKPYRLDLATGRLVWMTGRASKSGHRAYALRVRMSS